MKTALGSIHTFNKQPSCLCTVLWKAYEYEGKSMLLDTTVLAITKVKQTRMFSSKVNKILRNYCMFEYGFDQHGLIWYVFHLYRD